jgi:hypothetical protein
MLLLLFCRHPAGISAGTLAPPGAGYTRPLVAVARPVQASATRPQMARVCRPANPRRR